jgi:hypothetical protein
VAVSGAALLLLPALARWQRGLPLEGAEVLQQPLPRDTEASSAGGKEQGISSSLPLSSSLSWVRSWLPIAAVVGLATWLLALWILPQPPLFDRPQTRADALMHGAAAARDLGFSIGGLYGAATPDSALLGLDTDYLRDHPGTGATSQTIAAEGARAAWRVRFSQWDRDDTLTLWLGARGELIAFERSLPEDAPGAAIPQARAQQLATELLERQRFDLGAAALVEASTITRTNRVDHRFVWQSERVVGEAARPRVLVTVQGDQVAALSPFLFTPPEYRRERDRTTVTSLLQRDTLPMLPDFVALLLIVAGLLLATRRPPPLRLVIIVGLVGVGAALLAGLLRLDAAQLAQPPRLIQGATLALLTAILAGAGLALVASGVAMLWARAFPAYPALDSQLGVHSSHGQERQQRKDRKGHIFSAFAAFSVSPQLATLWSDGCRLALALLPALLAFGALRAGLNTTPGVVRSPGALGAFVPAAALLLEGALAALRTALLLAGGVALLSSWRALRPFALPLVTLGAVLVAAQPNNLGLLALALLAWPVAILLARLLRGNMAALLLALWWAACLPDALALLALDQWWYAANGALAILALIAPILLWHGRDR